ncbi:DHHW family protein [Virgibacillus oceani]|uniref:AlgX/AlgJ SGNH hydrolase-like domain-containing protein n=1 Tax=Virgibacillus oceani TaxID=1479511 RepID=A0A917HAS0_9BACI|nr:DHHW family protein [Virgibacillus oceani]GGG73206.1 hypothetical protein GCM10011398_17000 [Virgibacillus oceani]
MKKKIGDTLVVISFFLVIFVIGIIYFVSPDKAQSELENRKLDQRPDATLQSLLSGDYFKRFGAYYTDQFPARNQMIEYNAVVNKFVLQKDVIQSIYVHDDGYLMDPVVPSDHGLTPKEIAAKINSFGEKLSNEDINVYFALTPNKTTMMEYKLPDYVESYGNDLSDRLMDQIKSPVKGIDLRGTIKDHMDESNLYFYTDHHWKPKAAHYAYEEIMNQMREDNRSLPQAISHDQFTWEEMGEPFYGSDARKTTKTYAKKADSLTVVRPKFDEKPLEICYRNKCDKSMYDMEELSSKDVYANKYRVYFSGDFSEGIVRNPNVGNDTKLLILKDSYANSMLQFVVRNFSETRILDLRHYDKESIYAYIEEHDIDNVLFIHNINSIVLTPSFVEFGE